jgi:hypothetical protein
LVRLLRTGLFIREILKEACVKAKEHLLYKEAHSVFKVHLTMTDLRMNATNSLVR